MLGQRTTDDDDAHDSYMSWLGDQIRRGDRFMRMLDPLGAAQARIG